MSSLFNYSPEAVTVLALGFVPIEGFVDGTFISINKDILPSVAVRTPDGTVARVMNYDQTYTISLTLHNGSESNEILTKLWQLDEISQGRGKFPLLVKDSSGSDLFFSTTTWIEQIPSLDKSVGIDQRTWVLRSAFATINVGGNGDQSSLLEDLVNTITSALPALNGVV